MTRRYRDNIDEGDGLHKLESGATRYRDNKEAADGGSGSFEIRQSLPAPEEVHTDQKPRKWTKSSMMGNKKLLLLVTAAIFATAAIIGLSVSIFADKSSNNVDANENYASKKYPEPPTTIDDQPHRNPDLDVTQRFRSVADYMAQYAYVDVQAMADPASPQYLAAQWLGDQDEAALDVPSSTDYDEAFQFVQRFVMAVFYFGTGGPNWTYDLNFLTGDSVCAWSDTDDKGTWGAQCNDQGEVSGIYIRKCARRTMTTNYCFWNMRDVSHHGYSPTNPSLILFFSPVLSVFFRSRKQP